MVVYTVVNAVSSLSDPRVANVLLGGGIVVARTDTIYGVLARAADEVAVARVYALKERNEKKSPIVLIANYEHMLVPMPPAQRKLSEEVWPGKVTIAIPVDVATAPAWLHRGNSEFGHRMPDLPELRGLIEKTGPLIAPSANPEAHVPAMSIDEAYDYFGEAVDLYVDGGLVDDDTPSQLLRIDESGAVERLR